jgi:hypothetical protein
MKSIYILLACFLLPGVVKAQTSGANPDSSANDTNLATEVMVYAGFRYVFPSSAGTSYACPTRTRYEDLRN